MSHARSREVTHDEPEAGAEESAILTIDLDALVDNYRRLRDLAAPAECAAVVKADAYGLGMAQAASALWRAGCKRAGRAGTATKREPIDSESGCALQTPFPISGASRGIFATFFAGHGIGVCSVVRGREGDGGVALDC